MLTEKELGEIKGLLHYINNNLSVLSVDDVRLIDSNGETVAIIGTDSGAAESVLKAAPLQ